MRRGHSILTIYEHALKPYIKLSSHMTKCQTYRKEETRTNQVKSTVSQYGQYCATALNAYSEQVSVKSKVAKQFMYNWLRQAKILSKFYRNERKWLPFHWLWASSWHLNFQTKKCSNNEHE